MVTTTGAPAWRKNGPTSLKRHSPRSRRPRFPRTCGQASGQHVPENHGKPRKASSKSLNALKMSQNTFQSLEKS